MYMYIIYYIYIYMYKSLLFVYCDLVKRHTHTGHSGFAFT